MQKKDKSLSNAHRRRPETSIRFISDPILSHPFLSVRPSNKSRMGAGVMADPSFGHQAHRSSDVVAFERMPLLTKFQNILHFLGRGPR
jgi:hypothetical protein